MWMSARRLHARITVTVLMDETNSAVYVWLAGQELPVM